MLCLVVQSWYEEERNSFVEILYKFFSRGGESTHMTKTVSVKR